MRAGGAVAALLCFALPAGCGDDGGTVELRVPSEAMQPAYAIGDEVEVDTTAYGDIRPKRGEVVVFRAPRGIEDGECGVPRRARQPCARPTRLTRNVRLMMRVIGRGGDRIAFREGIAIVNGAPEERELRVDDPACALCELPVEITVPPGHVFVAADNRSRAPDSRAFGPVPLRALEGKVLTD
jgi:signal peptidase I